MDVLRLRLTAPDARQLLRTIEQFARDLVLEGLATMAAHAADAVQWDSTPAALRSCLREALWAARCCRPDRLAWFGYVAIALVVFARLRRDPA